MTKGDTVTEHTETTQAAEPTESDLNAVEYPFNTMSQDWSGEDMEGFCYHEITDECKAACSNTHTTQRSWKEQHS